MGTYRKELDKKCPKCGIHLIEVSMKNPFIDDFQDGCENPGCEDCEDLEAILNRKARIQLGRNISNFTAK